MLQAGCNNGQNYEKLPKYLKDFVLGTIDH